jgi:prolyl-tRNA editing enzyme YbaK/EbsC (Cys-tRNA(Pro) deacylase)
MKSLLHPAVAAAIDQYRLQCQVMECKPELADTAAFCDYYKFDFGETCNAIIAAGKVDPPRFACCVVLANSKLDVNKRVCQLLSVKRCSFASADLTLSLTGMEIGGVTPIGLPPMPIFFDAAIMENQRIVLGGGNRTSKLLLDPQELKKIPYMEIVDGLGLTKTS